MFFFSVIDLLMIKRLFYNEFRQPSVSATLESSCSQAQFLLLFGLIIVNSLFLVCSPWVFSSQAKEIISIVFKMTSFPFETYL